MSAKTAWSRYSPGRRKLARTFARRSRRPWRRNCARRLESIKPRDGRHGIDPFRRRHLRQPEDAAHGGATSSGGGGGDERHCSIWRRRSMKADRTSLVVLGCRKMSRRSGTKRGRSASANSYQRAETGAGRRANRRSRLDAQPSGLESCRPLTPEGRRSGTCHRQAPIQFGHQAAGNGVQGKILRRGGYRSHNGLRSIPGAGAEGDGRCARWWSEDGDFVGVTAPDSFNRRPTRCDAIQGGPGALRRQLEPAKSFSLTSSNTSPTGRGERWSWRRQGGGQNNGSSGGRRLAAADQQARSKLYTMAYIAHAPVGTARRRRRMEGRQADGLDRHAEAHSASGAI